MEEQDDHQHADTAYWPARKVIEHIILPYLENVGMKGNPIYSLFNNIKDYGDMLNELNEIGEGSLIKVLGICINAINGISGDSVPPDSEAYNVGGMLELLTLYMKYARMWDTLGFVYETGKFYLFSKGQVEFTAEEYEKKFDELNTKGIIEVNTLRGVSESIYGSIQQRSLDRKITQYNKAQKFKKVSEIESLDEKRIKEYIKIFCGSITKCIYKNQDNIIYKKDMIKKIYLFRKRVGKKNKLSNVGDVGIGSKKYKKKKSINKKHKTKTKSSKKRKSIKRKSLKKRKYKKTIKK